MRIGVILAAACVVFAGAVCAPASAMVSIRPLPIPVPGPGWVRVWVPAEYRTVYDRLWVEERTERVQERVWVSATTEWREVVYYDQWGRRCVRREWVEVTAGYWTYPWRTIVVPAHYETAARQELLRDGYWKWVRVDAPMPRVPMPGPVYGDPPTVGVEGYQPGTGSEDLSKFSPLYEWPDSKK